MEEVDRFKVVDGNGVTHVVVVTQARVRFQPLSGGVNYVNGTVTIETTDGRTLGPVNGSDTEYEFDDNGMRAHRI